MKKTLLVAALTMGFAGVAQAETSVTLYGIADAALQHQSVKIDGIGKADRTGMTSGGRSGSRFGLKGSEDLGNGLKAIFTLEQGFDIGTGDNADGDRGAFNRQAFVGLAGDSWGAFTMGRQYSISDGWLGAVGPFGNSFGLASQPVTFASGGHRYDNLFRYETPNFAGFQAAIGYSNDSGFGGQTWNRDNYITGVDTDSEGNALTAGLRYANGPLNAVATFDRLGDVSNGAGGTGSIKAWNLGGSYDFEVVKLALIFGQDRDGRIAANSGNIGQVLGDNGLAGGGAAPVPNAQYIDGFKANNYLVGLSAPLGAGKVMGAWGMSDSNLSDADVNGSVGNGFTGGEAKQHAFSLGYAYSLSKRTDVYAVGSYVKNLQYIDGAKGQEYRIGMRHAF